MTGVPPLALSVRQPWAHAIIYAGKDVENRSHAAVRNGLYGGVRVAIHASRGMTKAEYQCAAQFMLGLGITCPKPAELLRGGDQSRISAAVQHPDILSRAGDLSALDGANGHNLRSIYSANMRVWLLRPRGELRRCPGPFQALPMRLG